MQRQIRSKQFTADTIDSVVGRLGQVRIPVPKDACRKLQIEGEVQAAILGRAEIKEQLAHIIRELDLLLQGNTQRNLSDILAWRPSAAYEGMTAFLKYRSSFAAFLKSAKDLTENILVPRYYDPYVANVAPLYSQSCERITVGQLVQNGIISLTTGDEIGKLAYGTGDIPFVRTSDFGSWELKREPKQGISREIYEQWSIKRMRPCNSILSQERPLMLKCGYERVRSG